ncbi:synaptotagmin-16 isoform X2 [Octopus sinensis]|uniref:Synaptotagmin-16 isoform X2 n=1 Tax=Octopus sinensis TaxID=2607531 RepID=A0A7E6FH68_9MOLL|nr:synaptotagmin-16 isoform X2 [Octopus sinensis]
MPYKYNNSAYAFDDSSSESEDEIIKRYQHSFKTEQKKLEKEVLSSQSIKRTKSTKSNDLPSQNSTVKSTDLAPRKASSDGNISSKYQDIKETKKLEKNKVSEAVPKKTEAIVPSQSTTTHLSEPLVRKGAETSTSKLTTTHNDRQSDAEGISNQAFQDEVSLSMSVNSDVLDSPDHNSDEHLFDISDLHQEPPLISKCGSLEVTFLYSPEENTMKITILQAQEIPSKDRGGANSAQVRILLLPTKKQRFKTKIKPGDNPEFGETFTFQKIQKEDLMNMGVRFRLYGCERMRRERMLGEAVIGFASINPDMESTHWILLEPRSNLSHGDSRYDVSSLSRSESGSSSQSMQHGGMPELFLGLSYNGTTGRLMVEVVKGSNFRNMAMNRAPDTYVKLTLMSPTGKEIARSKTSIRRGQPNPLFRETFVFQVALFQLPELTLMISVYNKRSMKRKEMIGWFALGMKSSGEEEQSHWNDMCENKGEEVQRWHVLLES